MNKQSNIDNIHTVQHQSSSIDAESSSSDFSFSRTKKIQRRIKRKKMTKIVHTYCFLYKTPEGKEQTIYFQQMSESAIKDQQALKNLASKQLRQNKSRMLELAKQKAGLPKRKNTEMAITNEVVNVQPLPHFYHPSQFYYIY